MAQTSKATYPVPKPDAEPNVPFCAAARVATVVVLARHSVLGRRCEIADSAHADIRRRYQSLQSLATALCAGNAHPVTSLFAKVACARNGLAQGARGFRSDRQAFSVGPRGKPCAKLSRNVASPVHLADEPLPAHCWRHSRFENGYVADLVAPELRASPR